MITFNEATEEQRRIYYQEEWNPSKMPDFIKKTINKREFGFDRDGSGPNDRYNQFSGLEDLENYLKKTSPYAAYSSVSFYEYPKKRENWLGAELVFDVDAKDLPIKSCDCEGINICEKCLEDAKEIALGVLDILKDDFSLKDLHVIYSGRGYHIRVQDSEVYPIKDRSYILDYILATNNKDYPENTAGLFTTYGYARVFRKRFNYIIKNIKEEMLKNEGIRSDSIQKIIDNRNNIVGALDEGDIVKFEDALSIGKKTKLKLFEIMSRINAQLVDARVTVDVKRILRLPSSLHSKVSMICTYVKSPETFDPQKEAVPKFAQV